MSGGSLDALLTPSRLDATRFGHVIPEGWNQGRGAYGGLVLGLLTRAMDVVCGDASRALRNLSGQICGPTQPGEIEIVVEALRIGSAVSTLRATLRQAGEVQAAAVGVFGSARRDVAGTESDRLPQPTLGDWRTVDAIAMPSPPAPPFIQHFEIRPTLANLFGGTSNVAATAGWARPRIVCAQRDAAYLVAQADIWWPAILTQLATPRPMATIAFTLDVCGTLDGLPAEEPLFHHGEVLASRDGFVVEQRQLRGSDGRLVALNQQTFVIIK